MGRPTTDLRRATVEELSKAVLLARDMGANEIELRGEQMTLVMRSGAKKGPFLITHFATRSGHVVMSVGQSTRLPGNARFSCNLGEDSSLLVHVFLGGSWGLPA